MHKTPSYNINEASMCGALGSYTFQFDEQIWSETEQALDSLGLQRKRTLTSTAKKTVVLCALVLSAGGLLAFINLNRNNGGNNTEALAAAAPAVGQQESAQKVYTDVPELSTGRKATVPSTPAVVADTIKATEQIVSAPPVTEKKSEVVAEPLVEKSAEVKTDDQPKETPKKKKRKKRSRRNSGSKVTPASHNSADDEVIIN